MEQGNRSSSAALSKKQRLLLNRNLAFYALMLAVFGLLSWFVFDQGSKLKSDPAPRAADAAGLPASKAPAASQNSVTIGLAANLSYAATQPLTLLLLQIAVILTFARLLGYLFARVGQPMVIGEIVAGVLLGPSVAGLFWPEFGALLFRQDSLPGLQSLSQIGLILFMFIVGMELDVERLKPKIHAVILVSHASIVLPFLLGVSLAYVLFEALAPPDVSFLAFGLFMGVAMSITAFPVLARIIRERGLTDSPLGALALTCAAAGDVTAWCLLVVVIAVVQAGPAVGALWTVFLSGLYVLGMLLLVRPLLRRLGARYAAADNPGKNLVALALIVLILSALFTEAIGIHALFGAFVAGLAMPARAEFRKTLAAGIEDVSLVILLPLFFAFTGLKTQIGLLNDANAWLTCGLIVLVAVAGKFGGSLIAARFTGHAWPDSLALGALMNTRGLMELIVLNIGYDLGVLSPRVFTMLVLMALITTFMTSPALTAIQHFRWKREQAGVGPLPERL